ncbi:1981_t:CDS:2 [Entrophospora sp. SA101]|nr:1981_t:CDS:2 [Entrophospora sp. SA101]
MDIFGLCLPLVDITAKLARDAYKTAEDARYTKKICLILADRLEIGSRALSDLYRHRDEKDKEEKFKSSNFYNSLQSYVNAATEIKRFIDEVSKLSGAMKYIKSSSHKGKVNQLVKRYDEAIADLKLGISLDEFKEIHDLQNTMETEFEKIDMKLMIDTLASMSNSHKQPIEIKSLEIKSIGQHDLRDPDPEQVVKRGKVFKKLLKGYEPVACKPFTDEEYKEEDFRTRLAILGKLFSSNSIVKFLGTSCADGFRVLVFEWAEYGNLKSFYEKYDINWQQKLKIVHDVCAGLAFLHECTIFHHDVRCENILIMDNIGKAKIANFSLSREYHNKSIRIKAINELIPWMAPEKLKDPDGVRYTLKCEIFSFGMFVWELSFQQVPYFHMLDNDGVKITHYILEGGRESVRKLSRFDDIQKCFKNIIVKAWNQEPSLRPNMPTFLTQLATLYRNYYYSPHILPKPRVNNYNDSGIGKEITPLRDDDDLSLDTLTLDDAPKVTMTLEDGIKLHKDKNDTSRKLAWECFKYHAEVLKDPRAIYWKGYYLLEGYGGIEKNSEEASRCFKEAADQDISDAQVRYAFSILNKVGGNPLMASEFMKYMEKAAFHENQVALYNMGDIYYEGKLNLPRNQKQAIIYYKKAALKGHEKSIKKLQSLNISIYGD